MADEPDNVIKLIPEEVGEGFRLDADELLDAAKGNDFDTLVIMGQMADGQLWISGSANLGETIVLIELAKNHLLFAG